MNSVELINDNKEKMKDIALVEVNREKAVEWLATKEGLSTDEVEDYPFFEDLHEVYKWIYIDENDSHQDTIDTLNKVVTMDVTSVLESGVTSIAEYMALSWERLAITPYGYLAVEI